jgi:glycosyltransferase involved in cell wall biosynthesis
MKLSVCLAVYNEEKFIHYPLDSIYDFADEVVIVDGGSTDKTVEVALSYGKKIKIFHEKNPKMFHINKQKAIEKAKGEWILQLDADEEVSKELKEEIKKIINETRTNIVAYWIPRKNFFLYKFLMKGGVYPDYTIRLYKNGVAKFPCKTVHENVDIKGKIDYLKNPLLHFADPEFSRYLKRWKRYTSLDAEILAKQKEKLSLFSYLFVKPISWFFSSYIKHKGFLDGFAGLIFSFFSSIRFIPIYLKFNKLKKLQRK